LHLAGQWGAVGKETGVPSRLAKVLGGGEPGLGQPEIRRRITQALGITHLRETMGLGDVISGMWAECEAQDGMHFNAQRYVAIELVDAESGDAVPWREGATGEIVYSAFARRASPVLRYRSRDHALVVGTRCPCGRTSPRIRCIGRTDDMLIYKGMNVFPGALRDVIATRFAADVEPLVRVWKERKDQVRFDDAIALDVEATPDFDMARAQTLCRDIEDEVRRQLQVRIRVSVLARGTLPRSAYKTPLLAVREGT
jgi:phenylacetate-CoA ligase/benzoylacetate-CoA ligase